MKRLILVMLILTLATGSAFAQLGTPDHRAAIGIEGGLGLVGGQMPGLSLTGKVPQLPVVFGLWYTFAASPTIGVTADWWLFQTPLTGPLHLYLGPGLGILVGSTFDLTARLPIGLQLFVLPPLELFLELTPGLGFFPTPNFHFNGAVGARFWF